MSALQLFKQYLQIGRFMCDRLTGYFCEMNRKNLRSKVMVQFNILTRWKLRRTPQQCCTYPKFQDSVVELKLFFHVQSQSVLRRFINFSVLAFPLKLSIIGQMIACYKLLIESHFHKPLKTNCQPSTMDNLIMILKSKFLVRTNEPCYIQKYHEIFEID